MHLTVKQIELLSVIGKGNDDNSATDLDQILERLSYKPTKQSLQFSIRALIAHGLIQKDAPEKRRGRTRTLISLTKTGKVMVGAPAPSFVEEEEFDDLLSDVTESFEP